MILRIVSEGVGADWRNQSESGRVRPKGASKPLLCFEQAALRSALWVSPANQVHVRSGRRITSGISRFVCSW